jgi:hypothetical protein
MQVSTEHFFETCVSNILASSRERVRIRLINSPLSSRVMSCVYTIYYSNISDPREMLCFDRKLFNSKGQDGSHDNHYPYLWRDM